ncbi:MAG: hypothetical protein AAF721_26770, partial [Myxococcota bacterium]
MRPLAPLPIVLLLSCAGTTNADSTPADGAAAAAPEGAAPAVAGDPRFDPPFVDVPDSLGEPPRYKPSSKSPPRGVPITTNAYGAFTGAPDAPELGDTAADFTVALASGGTFDLGEARA